jgi:hypothetical protein
VRTASHRSAGAEGQWATDQQATDQETTKDFILYKINKLNNEGEGGTTITKFAYFCNVLRSESTLMSKVKGAWEESNICPNA